MARCFVLAAIILIAPLAVWLGTRASTPISNETITVDDGAAPEQIPGDIVTASAPVVDPAPAHEWPEPIDGSTVEFTCIKALSQHHAIVGGALMIGGLTLHSCLFETTDGGSSWNPLGPAVEGARIVAIDCDRGGNVWALGHQVDAITPLPFMLHRSKAGAWKQNELGHDTVLDQDVTSGRITFASHESGSILLELANHARIWLTTADAGDHWGLSGIETGTGLGHPSNSIDHKGWAWRLRENTVEQRAPGAQWVPTEGQPSDGYEAGDDVPFMAAIG